MSPVVALDPLMRANIIVVGGGGGVLVFGSFFFIGSNLQCSCHGIIFFFLDPCWAPTVHKKLSLKLFLGWDDWYFHDVS